MRSYDANNFIGNYLKSWYQFDGKYRTYAYLNQDFEVEDTSLARLVWIDFMLLELEDLKLDLMREELSSFLED